MTTPITIIALVPATPATACAAFNDPQAITQWNRASPEWHCPPASVDLLVGGRHVARMEVRDGSFGFDYEGSYEEVDAPHAVTLRLDDGRSTRTTFEPEGTGTRVTTVFDPEGSTEVEMQRAGWQAILDSYAAYVARSEGWSLQGKTHSVNARPVSRQDGNTLIWFFRIDLKNAEGRSVEDVMQGEWRFWRETGELRQVGQFRDGLKHGTWLRHACNGGIEKAATFDNGRPVKAQVR